MDSKARGESSEARDDDDDEDDDEDEEGGEEDRFVFNDEAHREAYGGRYDEFKARFERAVNAVDIDALCELAEDFSSPIFPGAGKKAGKNKKAGCPKMRGSAQGMPGANSVRTPGSQMRKNSLSQGISQGIFEKKG